MSFTPVCSACPKAAIIICGPCATNGIDVRYCSDEHQKAMESTHSLVCGRVLKCPFLPPLTPLELLFKLLNTRNPDPRKPKWWKDGPVPNAMEDQLQKRLVVRDNEMYNLNKYPSAFRSFFKDYQKYTSAMDRGGPQAAYERSQIIRSINHRFVRGAAAGQLDAYVPPPDLGPSIMPYHILGTALRETPFNLMKNRNAVDFINAVVTYATMYIHEGLADAARARALTPEKREMMVELFRRIKAERKLIKLQRDPQADRDDKYWDTHFEVLPFHGVVNKVLGELHGPIKTIWKKQAGDEVDSDAPDSDDDYPEGGEEDDLDYCHSGALY